MIKVAIIGAGSIVFCKTLILDILATGTKEVDEIVQLHFKASLLEGPGRHMAANEIVSHAELLMACGDLSEVAKHRYTTTGSTNFEGHIQDKQKM